MTTTEAIRERRAASIWTRIHPMFAIGQLGVFVVSVVLLGLYFAGIEPFAPVYLSVLIKITLMVGAIVTGSLWEHDVYGPWWFAKEFLVEDIMTAIVFALHVVFLVAIFTVPHNLDVVIATLIVAYGVYGLNVVQYIVRHVHGVKADAAPTAGPSRRQAA